MIFEPVRVLHIVGAMDRGGVETWLMNMLRNLDRRQIAMDFLCLSGVAGAYAPEIERLGGRVYLCSLDRIHLIRFTRSFSRLLKLGHYDVVHSHVLTFSGFLLWLASLRDIPQRLAHFHTSKVTAEGRPEGLARNIYLWVMKQFLKRAATRFLACSEVAMTAVLGDDWPDNPRCEVLYYGIDLSAFHHPEDRDIVRQKLGLPLTAKVIGHVGGFSLAKNHEFLVTVAEELCRRRAEVRFLLVGDGELRPHIERLVAAKGLTPYFVFTGARGDVPRLMHSMDLFLLPSVREGLGIVLIEAQAAGLPLVTSQLPAFKEVVFTPFHKGLPLGSPQVWAQACEDFMSNGIPKKPSSLVWQRLERFSVERCTALLSEIYLGRVNPAHLE
jgi:glycosyltransferase involved in cell wall biosynthesis